MCACVRACVPMHVPVPVPVPVLVCVFMFVGGCGLLAGAERFAAGHDAN